VERLVYSVDETAEQLGVNRKSVYDAVKRNELPHIRVGHRILVPKVALDRLMADCAEGAK